MAKKLQQHLLYKSSLGEKISIDNICSFIESNEVLHPELRITHPLNLPSVYGFYLDLTDATSQPVILYVLSKFWLFGIGCQPTNR